MIDEHRKVPRGIDPLMDQSGNIYGLWFGCRNCLLPFFVFSSAFDVLWKKERCLESFEQ